MRVHATAQDEAMKLLQDMKAVFAPGSPFLARFRQNIDRFTSEIECLKYGGSLAALEEATPWASLPLTALERKFVAVLKRAGERGMEKSGLLTVLYAEVPDNSWPEIKIIDVWAAKIRKKFYDAKLTNPLETVWGRGYIFRDPVRSKGFADTYAFKRGEDGMTIGSSQYTRRNPDYVQFRAAERARKVRSIWKPKESAAA